MNDQEFREHVVGSLSRIEEHSRISEKRADKHSERLDDLDESVTNLRVEAKVAKRTGTGGILGAAAVALWEQFK